MMNRPLVTIVIPVYNGANYLREAIESALSQTYENIEIVVVNDGSKDQGATEAIALSYGNKIRYFNKENGGVATALNLAIKEMKGDYFSWLSHDDLYYTDKVAAQIQALVDYGELTTIVHSAYDILQEPSKTITHVIHSNTYPNEHLTNSVLPVLQGLVHGCSLLIHKSHFERVGYFDESLRTTQDYDLWFRMMRNQKLIYISKPLVIGRVHETQQGRTVSSYQSEREQLHINFIKELTEDEMSSMFGSPYNFYHRMSCFFKGVRMNESYQYTNKKLQESTMPDNLFEQITSLKAYISELTNGFADKIAIFCAGEYGMRLLQELRSKLIKVKYFSDNNPTKWGGVYERVECIPPHQLMIEKDRTLIIVATQTPEEIVKQLEKDFPYVFTKQQLDKMIMSTPPIKWITALDGLNVDYSSADVQQILSKFDEVITEMSQFQIMRA